MGDSGEMEDTGRRRKENGRERRGWDVPSAKDEGGSPSEFIIL